jgi:ligand-binding sensor domain-containing protein
MVIFLGVIVIRRRSEEPCMMNTLHKSLIIAILVNSIFISTFNVDLVGAQNRSVDLTTALSPTDPLQSLYIKFDRLTAEDGLSSNQTWELAQDKHGFMWFGTANGLSRYDGASIKVYRNDPDDPNSLSNNLVRAMIADKGGDLWIGTWGEGVLNLNRTAHQQQTHLG